jgi:nucleotide-binding universal stress UspA family protein
MRKPTNMSGMRNENVGGPMINQSIFIGGWAMEEKPMSKEKSILFGIDDSDFARQALTKAGGLLKNCNDLKMTLFHGASIPDFSIYPESIAQEPEAIEKQLDQWGIKSQRVLEKAAEALKASGFDPDNTASILDKKSIDPSGAMLKLAGQEGIETIAVARWGKSSISRQVMGSVTYRLSHLADDVALWVIDPRISSHNVLMGLVGAPVSRRVVDYMVRYFSHLKESKFTLMHVIPPIPPQYWEFGGITALDSHEQKEKLEQWTRAYTSNVQEIAYDAKNKLVQAGIPEQNVVFKFEPQKKGIARDILGELEKGDHGILVFGRKGYKAIKEFGLGSKAYKLLILSRAFIVCLVK